MPKPFSFLAVILPLLLSACATPYVVNRPIGEDFCLESWHKRLGHWELWDLDQKVFVATQIDEKRCLKITKPFELRVVVFGKEKRRHCRFRVYPGDSVFVNDALKQLTCELRPSDPYRPKETAVGKEFSGEAVPEKKPW
jgi:hypothetical protein